MEHSAGPEACDLAGVPGSVVFGALIFSWVGGASLPYLSRAYQIGYFSAVAIALAYGVAIIVFARRPKVKPVVRVGLSTTPAARRWYGLAFVAPALLGLSIASSFTPYPIPPGIMRGSRSRTGPHRSPTLHAWRLPGCVPIALSSEQSSAGSRRRSRLRQAVGGGGREHVGLTRRRSST